MAAAPRRPRAAARRRRPRASARRSRPSRWPCAGCRRAGGGWRRGPTNAGCTSLRLWWRRLGHGSGKKIRIPASEASGTFADSSATASPRSTTRLVSSVGPHEQRRDPGLEDLDGEVVDVGLGRRQRGRRLAHARADLQDQRGSPAEPGGRVVVKGSVDQVGDVVPADGPPPVPRRPLAVGQAGPVVDEARDRPVVLSHRPRAGAHRTWHRAACRGRSPPWSRPARRRRPPPR